MLPRSLRRPTLRARRRALSTLGLLVLAGLALMLVAWSNVVEVTVDGEEHALRTYAGTVADVLDQLEVEVGPHDEVRPGKAVEVDDGLEIQVDRAITVEIVLDGEPETVTAAVTSVAGALEEAGIGVVRRMDADIVPAWTAPVDDGDTVTVTTPNAVTIEVDGEVHQVETLASTVHNVLVEQEVDLEEQDRVRPAVFAPIEPDTHIVVERVEVEEVVEEVVLEHGEERRETDELNRGTTRVEQEGSDGLRLDTYSVRYVDGEEMRRELVDEEVVEEPEDRIVLVGTFVPPPPPPPDDAGVWDRLAQCEANGNWSARGRFHGGLQFHPGTWRRYRPSGYPEYAYQATREQQIHVAERVLDVEGWGAWPHCSRVLGLR